MIGTTIAIVCSIIAILLLYLTIMALRVAKKELEKYKDPRVLPHLFLLSLLGGANIGIIALIMLLFLLKIHIILAACYSILISLFSALYLFVKYS